MNGKLNPHLRPLSFLASHLNRSLMRFHNLLALVQPDSQPSGPAGLCRPEQGAQLGR